MSRSIKNVVGWLSLWGALLLIGCGGGTDVGNPYQPISGMVLSRTSDGTKVTGARVVLARRGADPGLNGADIGNPEDDLTFWYSAIFFDTTYTTTNGQFRFDSMPPAEYVLVASYNDLVTLEYISHGSYEEDPVDLVLADPATVSLKNYTAIDTSQPHFIGARIAGTEIAAHADTNNVIMFRNAPAGELDLILYRNDDVREHFDNLRTNPGCSAELYTLPDLSTERWTPHPCGIRDKYGLPYILEIITWESGVVNEELMNNGREADMLISFSLDMNVLTTSRAIHGYAEGDSVSNVSLWWEGSNLVYITFCTADSSGGCRSGDDRYLQSATYGVIIDTTAQTSEGVHWAYEEKVPFVPVP